MKLMKTKSKILIIISSLILFYFILCTGLYFFEPVAHIEPNLTEFNHYFDSYSKYSVDINKDCYIRQITADDIVCFDDNRIKYVENTVLAITESDINYNDVTSLLKDYKYEVCGMIPDVNFYQLYFDEQMSFYDLLNLCENLTASEAFKIAIPDYFEETPAEESSSSDNDNFYSNFYKISNFEVAWQIFNNTPPVNIGIIDFHVDSKSKFLNVVNADDYSIEKLYEERQNSIYTDGISHGTHVAGIIGADANSEAPGVVKNAPIYSYNGINVSTSYWIASIYDMIANNNVKVINISMGFNPYIVMSASLGCENAISFAENDQAFFSAILSGLIKKGYEFVICAAAGNENNNTVYKIHNGYFEYGDKTILSKLDIFNIFDAEPDFVDAQYSYFFSDAPDKEVSDRIIIVGSVNKNGDYSLFSNVGNVDIAAPGESIYSTVLNDKYEYWSGTSMATPFVTGTAAMLFSINPDLTGAEVKDILISSATETSATDGFSYPILNAGNAVKSLINGN